MNKTNVMMLRKMLSAACCIMISLTAMTACADRKNVTSYSESTVSETESSAYTETETEVFEYMLSNPNANTSALRTYNYLCENYGKVMLACQQESTWMGSPDYEMDHILDTAGRLPAMRGLDFMNNDKDNLKEVYNSEKVITLDELPEL